MPREPRMKPSERIRDIANGYVSNYPEAIMIFLDEQYEKEGSIVGERGGKGWIRCGGQCVCCDVAQVYFLGEKSNQIQEKECKFYEMTNERLGECCLEHESSADKDDYAKKCPYRIPDCPIDYPDVSERNALIDELVEDVDRLELCRHDMVRIFVLLESKKK